jgi:adenine-specific DNA methylase
MEVSFPQTRYQGSKRKLIHNLQLIFDDISFETVLDAFGGTGAVSHLLKRMGKEVVFNDLLLSNWYIGTALIENKSVKFNVDKVPRLFKKKSNIRYQSIVQDNFKGIYYLDDENAILDVVIQNVLALENQYEKALCLFALFQACIQKRPFNLFHRKNLNLRLNNVPRSFGNKKTWDTPFIDLFIRALQEANSAVFNNYKVNQAINYSVLDIPIPNHSFDLVYLDPPYISENRIGVDYRDNYHFLEGISHYYDWENLIDYKSKHRKLKTQNNQWINPKKIINVFQKTVEKFQKSKIIISYRNPGIPTIEELVNIIKIFYDEVTIHKKDYKYALTSKQKRVIETIIVCE